MASKPEKETKDALKPYTEMSDTTNEITIMTNSKRGKKGFENKMILVISMVSPILIKTALTLRLLLPGMSPGAFKKAPTATGNAYSKYPKKYITPKGTATPTPSRIPRSKLVLFKNNSSCLSFSFKQLFMFKNKVKVIVGEALSSKFILVGVQT